MTSYNRVPRASRLAYSSAVYAALTKASALALDMPWSSIDLSTLARLGSRSAARSIYGGFVEWIKGARSDGDDSYAVPLTPLDYWDLSIVIVVVGHGAKSVSSREGMKRVVDTFLFYAGWLATVEADLNAVRAAILLRDFSTLGQISEANAFKMHTTALGATPPFIYWTGTTLDVTQSIQRWRMQGLEAYATIDVGAHVAVLC